MADNSNGGQYQVSDPSGTTDGNTTITGTVAPTPDGQTPPQPAATPASQPAAAAPPSNAPDASSPNPGAAGGQTAPPQSKPQAPAQPPPPQTRTQKFLARAREISDEIAGGDPYKTQIDPTTGETTRVRQPLSPRAISMSIILEALQGGLSGAGAHGPDAVGQAAQAGLKQGQQIAEQRQQNQANQDEQAQTDLRNRQQAITNTLQTRQLAQTLGRQSLEMAQKSVEADSAEWQTHQQDQSSIIAQGLSHDDAYAAYNKQPPGSAQVLITGVRPRVNPKTGKPVFQLPNGQIVDQDTPGAYQAPDFTYAVVKPTAKHTIVDGNGALSSDVQDDVKYGYQQLPPKDASGKYPANFQVDGLAYQAGHRGTQIAKALNVQINQERASLGLEPIDISKDTAQDSTVRNALLKYNAVLGSSHGDHQKAYDAVAGDPNTAAAAGTIQNWFGGREATQNLDNLRAQQDFASGVRSGAIPLDTPEAILRARQNPDPKVAAQGNAVFQQQQHDILDLKQKEENISVGGQIAVERAKAADAAKSALQAGNTDAAVDAIRSGSTTLQEVAGGYGKEAAARRNAVALAFHQKYPGESLEAYDDWHKEAQNNGLNGSLRAGRTLFGSNGQRGTLDQAEDLLESVPKTRFPTLNSWLNSADYQAGKVPIANAKKILADVPSELASFMTSAGGTQTDKRLQNAESILSTSDNVDQLQGAIKTIRQAGLERQKGYIGVNPYLRYNYGDLNDPTNRQPIKQGWAANRTPTAGQQPAPPQGAAGTMKFSDGNTYYVDANRKPIAKVTQ